MVGQSKTMEGSQLGHPRCLDNMSTSPCGFWPTTGIGYNIAYKTSDRNPNSPYPLISWGYNYKRIQRVGRELQVEFLSLPDPTISQCKTPGDTVALGEHKSGCTQDK